MLNSIAKLLVVLGSGKWMLPVYVARRQCVEICGVGVCDVVFTCHYIVHSHWIEQMMSPAIVGRNIVGRFF